VTALPLVAMREVQDRFHGVWQFREDASGCWTAIFRCSDGEIACTRSDRWYAAGAVLEAIRYYTRPDGGVDWSPLSRDTEAATLEELTDGRFTSFPQESSGLTTIDGEHREP